MEAVGVTRPRSPRHRLRGFSFVDGAAALLVLLLLGSLAMQHLGAFNARSRRVEAIQLLHVVRSAQESFFTAHRRYATTFDELAFALKGKGTTRIAAGKVRLLTYEFTLAQPSASSWICNAVGNVDDDEWPDVVTVVGTPASTSAPVVVSDDVHDVIAAAPLPNDAQPLPLVPVARGQRER
jgi:type II secretory pathway pseudopilin PulG